MTDGNGDGLKRYGHIPGMSPATLKLIEKLKQGIAGDTLTDEELSEACGRETKVGGDGYGNLQTAIRYCIRHDDLWWDRVKGAGSIRCLDAQDGSAAVDSGQRRTHRLAKRLTLKAKTVNVEELPEAQRPEYRAQLAQMLTIVVFSDRNTMKKLAARNVTEPIAMAKLLENLQ